MTRQSTSLVERFQAEVFGPYIELLRSEYRFHDHLPRLKLLGSSS